MTLHIRDLHRNHWREWRLGEPIPEDIGEVGIFQADGDELRLFLDAMKTTVANHPEAKKVADHSTNG